MGYVALVLALCVGVLVIPLYFQSHWLDHARATNRDLLLDYERQRQKVVKLEQFIERHWDAMQRTAIIDDRHRPA